MVREDVTLGKNVVIYNRDLVNLYGCRIGDNTTIAAFVEIQKGVKIGKNCKIGPFAFIPEGVVIEDGVFVGPHVCFTNDKYPQAVNEEGRLISRSEWRLLSTIVKERAILGAQSTVLCGITIGENSVVGAGSVVTKDVEANVTVIGNPATVLKKHDSTD